MVSHSPFANREPALIDIGPNGVNRLATMGCNNCGIEWVQPAQVGSCPRCGSVNTIVTDFRTNDLKRV